MRVVHHLHHAKDVRLVDDDTGQTEYTPGGIVGMNGHVDIVFVADRHDALQEVLQVRKQLLIVHILVHLEQFLDVSHTLRLPAGQDRTVGITADGGEHILGI